MSTPSPAVEPRGARWLIAALLAMMMIAGWGPRLAWGLWLDETFTVWQVDAGLGAIAASKLANPGQSALFAYIEAPFYFPHARHMELLLRLPAVAGALLSCVLLHRLAEVLVGKGTGLLALVPFVASPELTSYAPQARPYTLAMAACLAALLGLVRWLETGARRHGLLYAVSLALVLHLHLLFALFLPVLGVVLLQRRRRGAPIAWRGLALWSSLAVALLLPLIPLARSFLSQSAGLSRSPSPDAGLLAAALTPRLVLIAMVPAAILLLVAAARRQGLAALRTPGTGATVGMLLFWLLMPPLVLFVLSHAVGQSVVVGRYFFHTVAAQCLLVAILFRGFPPGLARVALFACFLPLSALHFVQSRSLPDGVASWRFPARALRALDPTATAPVFVQAGHPTSNAIDWQDAIAARSFLYSQLSAYPIANRSYPIPYALDDVVKAYVARLADGELAGAPLIFFAGIRDLRVGEWIRQFFEARGYASRDAVRQDLILIVLERPPQGISPQVAPQGR
jgi:hypothetical protein